MTSMDKAARAWLVTVTADHFWRVASWYEFEDLLQDGMMTWYRIVEKYETNTGRVRSRPHLMKLFKRSFLNHIHDLSRNKRVARVEVKADDVKPNRVGQSLARSMDREGSEGEPLAVFDVWGALGCNVDLGEYARMIVDAPVALRSLLQALIFGAGTRASQSEYRVRTDGTRETTNARLCRLVGANPDSVELADELRAFLTR